MQYLLSAFALAAAMLVSCDTYKKPAPEEINRIVIFESTYSGVKITGIRIVQDLFESRDRTCKVKLKISVIVEHDIIAYIKKGKKDFMPNILYWKAGDKKIIDADALLGYENDKKWHLKQYY
jgi:hypothetical protein